ncbi:RagB/SusD family nutrient uptake outer membrane protein [Sphingobacterium yanglingense]|uniref:SusD-like starch-binding protein associating with outer membrane n=1 Tax=Sphingobacterium yanglingense TaxID=1437280 RepID=A0A4R6WJH4_9SPHI|nr:RagB/SusD family nutrient uptake outer membrane protein [Sphingobacterium yanglingense]TDQ78124.1 SusD-like starch-binding protein associating with outer membrane [Sphingobacterium yanglingense]
METIKKYKSFIWLSALAFTVCISSCNKWLDVDPDSRVKDDKFFAEEAGFKNLLNGAYITMGDTEAYGRELSYGLVDVLAHTYTWLQNSDARRPYIDAMDGLYANAPTQQLIHNAWSKSYNVIANLNILMERLENADRSIFQPKNYEIIKGEAYGLRAFLHFDLLRLFSTSYLAGGENLPAIPYKKMYGTSLTPVSTAKEVVNEILSDLKVAEELLKVDPIFTGEVIATTTDEGYLSERKLRFNYYAVKALQARVYQWIGDSANALSAAKTVIDVSSTKFPWVLNSALTGEEIVKDRVFTTEFVFGLYQPKMLENQTGYLTELSAVTGIGLVMSAATRDQIYPVSESAADVRAVYLLRFEGSNTYLGRLEQHADRVERFSKRMPIIRIPEMYYIAAEAEAISNPAKAVEYLATVRSMRGVSGSLSPALTSEQINAEIQKEMRKEYASEGHLFYYYKRLNKTAVPGHVGPYNTARYKLPLPPAEIEFGI